MWSKGDFLRHRHSNTILIVMYLYNKHPWMRVYNVTLQRQEMFAKESGYAKNCIKIENKLIKILYGDNNETK